MGVSTVDAIKEAIERLPDNDQASLAAWLSLKAADAWDRQMQCDLAQGGKGAKFVKQVRSETADAARKGTVESLEKGFAQRRKRP